MSTSPAPASTLALLDTNAYLRLADDALVREIYEALEANGDLPAAWREAKHSMLKKVFGPER